MALKLSKTLTVNVTAERIARGVKGSSTCPIAVALGDRHFAAAVGTTAVTVSIPGGVVHPYSPYSSQRFGQFAEYRLPRAGRELVERFDAGSPVQPTTFRITRLR